jgi:Xaa-Pro aminopeptidase
VSLRRVNDNAGPFSERVRAPAPPAELERRWAAVRQAMEQAGVHALVVHNHGDCLGGYVKWFCDLPTAWGYPVTVVFAREGAMTLIMNGPHGATRELAPGEDGRFPGVGRIMTTWSFASASYTATYDPVRIVEALWPFERGRIGIVGAAQFPYRWWQHLKSELPEAELGDAADVVDPIKAVKSPYERAAIMKAIAMQRTAFEAAIETIEPGRREWEVVAAANAAAQAHGSIGGVNMVASAPVGEPAGLNPAWHQNRVLREGDRMTVIIEACGEDGFYGEFGRTVAIGDADDRLIEEHDFTLRAWRHAASGLRPGASPARLFASYNEFLIEHGRPPEQRLHAHGQGYDLIERPLIRSDETMTLERDMMIVVHPAYPIDGMSMLLCDSVFVEQDGATAPLHGREQRVLLV